MKHNLIEDPIEENVPEVQNYEEEKQEIEEPYYEPIQEIHQEPANRTMDEQELKNYL